MRNEVRFEVQFKNIVNIIKLEINAIPVISDQLRQLIAESIGISPEQAKQEIFDASNTYRSLNQEKKIYMYLYFKITEHVPYDPVETVHTSEWSAYAEFIEKLWNRAAKDQ